MGYLEAHGISTGILPRRIFAFGPASTQYLGSGRENDTTTVNQEA
jgi:hypothetical protein